MVSAKEEERETVDLPKCFPTNSMFAMQEEVSKWKCTGTYNIGWAILGVNALILVLFLPHVFRQHALMVKLKYKQLQDNLTADDIPQKRVRFAIPTCMSWLCFIVATWVWVTYVILMMWFSSHGTHINHWATVFVFFPSSIWVLSPATYNMLIDYYNRENKQLPREVMMGSGALPSPGTNKWFGLIGLFFLALGTWGPYKEQAGDDNYHMDRVVLAMTYVFTAEMALAFLLSISMQRSGTQIVKILFPDPEEEERARPPRVHPEPPPAEPRVINEDINVTVVVQH